MYEDAKQVAALMGLLSNAHRLLILCTLLEGPKTVGQISAAVPDISAPALSQHLHKLRDAKLICAEKQGQYIQYSILDKRLKDLIDLLRREYCTDYHI